MYYIVNKNNNIIAVDKLLLKLLEINDIEELQEKIILNKINFNYSLENNLEIAIENNLKSYTINKHNISSIIGDITLIELKAQSIIKDSIDKPVKENIGLSFKNNLIDNKQILPNTVQDKVLDFSLPDDSDELALNTETTPTKNKVELALKDNNAPIDFSLPNDSGELALNTKTTPTKEETELTLEDNDAPIDFSLPDDSDELALNIEATPTKEETELTLEDDDAPIDFSLADDSDELPLNTETTPTKEETKLTLEDDDTPIDFSLPDDSDELPLNSETTPTKEETELILEDDDTPIDFSLPNDSDELPLNSEKIETKDNIEDLISTDDELFDFDSDKLFDLDTEKEDIEEKISTSTESTIDDNDLFDIMSDDTIEEKEEEEIVVKTDNDSSIDDDLFNIMSEETVKLNTQSTNEEEDLLNPIADEPKEIEAIPLIIDIAEFSQLIGISEDDYSIFLNEYIDTAVSLENDLKSLEVSTKDNAINTLAQLSDVLHLKPIKDILENVKSTDADISNQSIQQLYITLSNITFNKSEATIETPSLEIEKEPEVEIAPEVVEPIVQTPQESEVVAPPAVEEIVPEEEIAPVIEESKGFGTIDLSDVMPIHFDFQLEAAAGELSLPVELIEEFVVDFIEQAHEETDKMLEAYTKGDLDAIQKLGHLLKGTSSNLRINPLADTLYKIQFCEDSSQLEDLIKDYWAHFISFEKKISLITK